jgi:hypothetical protein
LDKEKSGNPAARASVRTLLQTKTWRAGAKKMAGEHPMGKLKSKLYPITDSE